MGNSHITGKGDVGPCKASVKVCPLGGQDVHFGSQEEARAGLELKMAQEYDMFDTAANDDERPLHAESLERLTKSLYITEFVPREGKLEEYYASTDKKHFTDKTSAGSKFTDPSLTSLESITALALKQRKGLEGDDRAELIAMGANPAAFRDDMRYLKVRTPGKQATVALNSLPADAKITAMRTKAGGSVSLVTEVYAQPTVDFGVVVIGSPPGVDREIAITAHPGLPSRSTGKDTFSSVEGQTLTPAEVKAVAGTEQVNVTTKIVEPPKVRIAASTYEAYDKALAAVEALEKKHKAELAKKDSLEEELARVNSVTGLARFRVRDDKQRLQASIAEATSKVNSLGTMARRRRENMAFDFEEVIDEAWGM